MLPLIRFSPSSLASQRGSTSTRSKTTTQGKSRIVVSQKCNLFTTSKRVSPVVSNTWTRNNFSHRFLSTQDPSPAKSNSSLSSNNDPKKVVDEKNSPSSKNKAGAQHHKDHHGGMHAAKHQLQHRVREKVVTKVLEKTTTKVLPRLFNIKKRLGVQLLARKALRGVAIAIPAIGGIFALIVTYYDGKRTSKEFSKGNGKAASAFALATTFDIIDAISHLYTALGLLEITDAHHIHAAEELSLGAAIIATSAAIAGEFLTPLVVSSTTTHKTTISKQEDGQEVLREEIVQKEEDSPEGQEKAQEAEAEELLGKKQREISEEEETRAGAETVVIKKKTTIKTEVDSVK